MITATDSMVRHYAKRCGWRAHKSRAGFSLDNLGGYMFINDRNVVVRGTERYNLSAAEAVAWCKWHLDELKIGLA